MIAWVLLDKVSLPGEVKELRLYQRDTEFSIKIGTSELMNSRAHSSEDALARLACQQISKKIAPQVLIGGLGMGFTLRVALNNLKAKARVKVAELFPAVVHWNTSYIAHLAKKPLADKRVTIYEGDVADVIKKSRNEFDAIVLDVDNGAQGITQSKNDRLYTPHGLNVLFNALTSDGVLAIWSAGADAKFTQRLRKANFKVEEIVVRTSSGKKFGGQSLVWIAKK